MCSLYLPFYSGILYSVDVSTYLLQIFNIKTFAMAFNLIVFPTQEEQLCILHSYKIPRFSHCTQWHSYFIIKKADSFFTTYTKKIAVIYIK